MALYAGHDLPPANVLPCVSHYASRPGVLTLTLTWQQSKIYILNLESPKYISYHKNHIGINSIAVLNINWKESFVLLLHTLI